MKYQLKNQLKMKQTQAFHTKLYDSLELLKLSNEELSVNLLKAVQENPLLEIEFNASQQCSFDDSFKSVAEHNDLKTHLYFQLNTSSKKYDYNTCCYIIESLNNHGFFTENIEETCMLLGITQINFIENLRFIQTFEPVGVGAKDMQEALIIQCQKDKHRLAELILADFYHELINNNEEKIVRMLKVKRVNVNEEITYIKTLHPLPCVNYTNEQEELIAPEVKLEIINLKIVITPIQYFQISCNEAYIGLLHTNSVLKQYFQDAKTLINNIDKRNASLLLVMNEIVKVQQNYFLFGDELNPCKQNEIANRLGINASTVSRAISNKYYEFNGNNYPIKNLFVSSTKCGESSDAIKKAIIEIIENENKKHPFSDEDLIAELLSYNLVTSRRTISKYRDSMQIAGCRKRKKTIF